MGAVYLLAFVALVFGIKMFADRFEVRHGTTVSVGPIQSVLEFGAPFLALAIVGPIYAWVLGRYFPLRLDPSK